tara:strand:+ start:118 stop:285 length:168 start_codon:yes stop_codon:yes gene_type:complete
MKEQYAIFKEGGQIVFAGQNEVVQRAFACLRESFYFTAGSGKAREDAFPYHIEQI